MILRFKKVFVLAACFLAIISSLTSCDIDRPTESEESGDLSAQTAMTEEYTRLNYDYMKAVWLTQYDMQPVYTSGGKQRDKEEFIEKAKNTCVQRYGGASSQCSPIVREKSRQTLVANGNIPVSKPEKEMVGKIQEIYGEDNCVPQYGFSGLSFDCLLNIQNCKIDVEYDGIFWHDMNPEKDKRRDYFVIKNGYKVLRFRGETKSPSYEQIKEGVDYLVNSQHNHYTINI